MVIERFMEKMAHTWWGQKLASLATTTILVVGLLVIYWGLIDVDSPVTQIERHVRGVENGSTAQIYVGDTIEIEGRICSTRTMNILKVDRVFQDGLILQLPTNMANEAKTISSGCSKYVRRIAIPHILPPGKYDLMASVTAQLNPLRTVTWESPAIAVVVRRRDDWKPQP